MQKICLCSRTGTHSDAHTLVHFSGQQVETRCLRTEKTRSWHKRTPPSRLPRPTRRLCCVQHVYIFSTKASWNHKRTNQKLVGSRCTPPIGVYRSTLKLTWSTCFCDLYFLYERRNKPGSCLRKFNYLFIFLRFTCWCQTGGWLAVTGRV